jgi:hypothetical protein
MSRRVSVLLPQAKAALFRGLSQRPIFAGQRESSSFRELEIGGVIDRQPIRGGVATN